jgi:hypothetical protein
LGLTLRGLEMFRRDGDVEERAFGAESTAIIGPRNSSKTTTLKMIDFCLGDSDTVENALGSAVAENYVGLELTILAGEGVHRLQRALDRSFGQLTKVVVDGTPLDTREFQSWLMRELDWPELLIPRGRIARYATELVPLTFRGVFRHIYRKENSWLELASREEEFLRQAVVSFFLGIAEVRYSSLEFDVGEAERRVMLLEDRLRQATDESDRLLKEITHTAGLPESQAADLDELSVELAGELEERHSQRREVLGTIESNPQFLEEPGDRYKSLDAQLHEGALRRASLDSTVDAYKQAIQEISAQKERLIRARGSIELLSEIPVKSCPACGQPVAPRDEADAEEACYVCGQHVGPDVRERRIDLELNALAREQSETEESIQRAEIELDTLDSALDELAGGREALRLRLDRERAELIAPYLTQLEALNRSIGRLTQQIATVEALKAISSRRDRTAEELSSARSGLEETERAARRVETSRRIAADRCSQFANAMTEFLRGLEVERWGFGDVTLAETDMAFYVAARHWDVVLGAEARSLFLIAYHAALLQLPEDGQSGQPHGPGLAILDNPMQQGVPTPVIQEALERLLAVSRRHGGQVILTLPQDLQLSEVSALRLMEQYAD